MRGCIATLTREHEIQATIRMERDDMRQARLKEESERLVAVREENARRAFIKKQEIGLLLERMAEKNDMSVLGDIEQLIG